MVVSNSYVFLHVENNRIVFVFDDGIIQESFIQFFVARKKEFLTPVLHWTPTWQLENTERPIINVNVSSFICSPQDFT